MTTGITKEKRVKKIVKNRIERRREEKKVKEKTKKLNTEHIRDVKSCCMKRESVNEK
jgi:hypothetical protein